MSNDMPEVFSTIEKKNEEVEILKELFDKGKIDMITDFTKDEIKLYMRLYMIARMKNCPLWIEALEKLAVLMISKKRESRNELVRTISGLRNRGFFSRLRGGFGGNNDMYGGMYR